MIRALLNLVAFSHSIFSLTFVGVAFCAIFLQNDMKFDKTTAQILILCIFCVIFARNFAMAFNRLIDKKFDAQNPRTANRPSATGIISPAKISIFCAINAALFIFTSFFINSLAFALSAPFLAILAAYSFFKRFSATSHLVLGLCLALAPISCVIAFLGTVPAWCVTLSLGVACWVAGFDLLYALQDLEFDKKHGLFSVPARFGIKKTLIFSHILHIFTGIFWLIFLLQIGAKFFGFVGFLAAIFMLFYQQRLVSRSLSHINRAFFTTNGWLGVVFFCAMLLDLFSRRFL